MKTLEMYRLKVEELLQRYPNPAFTGTVSSLREKTEIMAAFTRNELPKLDEIGRTLIANDATVTQAILQDILIEAMKEHYNLPR
jgi:hypothetical protein